MDAGDDAGRDRAHTGRTRASTARRITLTAGLTAVASTLLAVVALPTPASAAPMQGPAWTANEQATDDRPIADPRRRCWRGQQLLRNGSFEFPFVNQPQGWSLHTAGLFTAWRTDDPQNKLEFWNSNMGVVPFAGRQFAEINATGEGNTIYQDFRTVPGTWVTWRAAVRARNVNALSNVDVTTVKFGRTPLGNMGGVSGIGAVQVAAAAASEYRWRVIGGRKWIPRNQRMTRISLTALVNSGMGATGNHVDAVSVIGMRCR